MSCYVKHIVYWDSFEDYRPEYCRTISGGPAQKETLVFRLLDNQWVLLYERDFCAPDADMLARMNSITGQFATKIHYSWQETSSLVARAEELAVTEAELIRAAEVIDLCPL